MAFTLVELLVVIAIIAVLVGLLLPVLASSFTEMPTWRGQRHRRVSNPGLILMADKGVSTADFLRTEGGYMLYYVSPTIRWLQKNPHSNHGAFRHAGRKLPVEQFQTDPTAGNADFGGCSALMADGHIELLSRRDLVLTAGHWTPPDLAFPNSWPLVDNPTPCCQ